MTHKKQQSLVIQQNNNGNNGNNRDTKFRLVTWFAKGPIVSITVPVEIQALFLQSQDPT